MTVLDPARQAWINRARDVKIQDELARRGFRIIGKNERAGPCPVCGGDDRFSINVAKQVWHCRGCGKGGDIIAMVEHIDGCDFERAVTTLANASPPPKPNGRDGDRSHPVGTWIYHDADGKPYLKVDRYNRSNGDKSHPQSHWDGARWITGKPKGPKIPYRLPELLDSDRTEPVYVCEGEKCADAVAKLGLAATSASEGAGKWTADLNEHFRDRIAYIVPDDDEPGRRHAEMVAHNLSGIARGIRIVKLDDLNPGEDVYDWIARGGTREQLDELGNAAPEWSPQSSNSDSTPYSGDENELPPNAEDSLALTFAERHKDELRYVAAWGRWMMYANAHWKHDDTLYAFDLVRIICREAASACEKNSTASAIASAKTVAAVERLAKADRRLAATSDQWDINPYLLGTPDGTVDLQTGQVRPARQSDYITKITSVRPGSNCPMWQAFLRRIMKEDIELENFIQRMFGYSLTGVISEHAMFFGHGTGANGKSVLISTVAGILGDYHTTSPIETFVASQVERHPTDLAGLRGARLVTAIETEEGRRWAETKIKTMTGGDRISARYMRQDFFEYTPQFKLLIAGNNKPSLRSVDEAIRRRFYMIPFAETIPEHERDKNLAEKLQSEWPGILSWMIDGCLEWQRIGLAPPLAVRVATENYLADQDMLSQWLDEFCDHEPNNEHKFESIEALFESWSNFIKKHRGEPGGKISFGDRLEAKGCPRDRTKQHGRIVRGIRLIFQRGDDR